MDVIVSPDFHNPDFHDCECWLQKQGRILCCQLLLLQLFILNLLGNIILVQSECSGTVCIYSLHCSSYSRFSCSCPSIQSYHCFNRGCTSLRTTSIALLVSVVISSGSSFAFLVLYVRKDHKFPVVAS